ncbi:DUF6153 family protein [Streptomyces niveiscabiei]|uniref:DUF6153 family protein n=1 Tax=Streptomyces niveiscabiei TaxID=164115 RepID=UPI0029AA675F|nr:DUF6153 family protein [Streptomyces niveiscabiei]MDX3384391.1 DUF6153 family protein [Streptomyces niveiscabiei]
MTRVEPCAVRSPLRGWPALACVLGVLVGLLAMHGLAPGGLHAVGHERTGGTAVSGAAPVMAGGGTHVDVSAGGCAGDGHCGGHARHADATCAAAKVMGAPVLAGPVADPVAVVVPGEAVRSVVRGDAEAARAPPSLAELQLLRI